MVKDQFVVLASLIILASISVDPSATIDTPALLCTKIWKQTQSGNTQPCRPRTSDASIVSSYKCHAMLY